MRSGGGPLRTAIVASVKTTGNDGVWGDHTIGKDIHDVVSAGILPELCQTKAPTSTLRCLMQSSHGVDGWGVGGSSDAEQASAQQVEQGGTDDSDAAGDAGEVASASRQIQSPVK